MPSGPLIAAFGSAQQTAISQLANAYCGEMMASTALRDAFFGGSGLDASLNNLSSSFFSTAANRTLVEQQLAKNAVGNANPQVAAAVTAEVDALLQKIPSLNPNATVSQATVAACTAVLGSAAVSLQ
jgi:hypothetical protein